MLPRRAVVYSPEMMALATARRTSFVVERNPVTHRTRAWTRDQPIEVLAIPYDEVQKGGGGIHCSTMELVRDPA